MRLRFTKDLVAVLITTVFLVWVSATAFAPLILHVQLYNDKGQTLVVLDALAAAVAFLSYIAIATSLPE